MVEEEELEPGRNTFEVGETEEISSAPVDSNDPGIEVPDTEDILGEEFMQEVLKAEFKDGEDVEKSSSNDLSQVRIKTGIYFLKVIYALPLFSKKTFFSLVC